MKVLAKVLFSLLMLAVVNSKSISLEDVIEFERYTAYDYHVRTGIPAAKKIREFEAQPNSRIAGGSEVKRGDIPYQAGILIDTNNGESVCGGSILAVRKVLTAAHCWYDGKTIARRFTVVVGSVKLYSGGQRLQTTRVAMLRGWNWNNFRNDIGFVNLLTDIQFNANVAPIALPTRGEISDKYVGAIATASGFGRTGDGKDGDITSSQSLSSVNLTVIWNLRCKLTYRFIHSSHLCTSGSGGKSTCGGDSGGPLMVHRNGRPILIGVTNFGDTRGCTLGYPAGFARVSSFIPDLLRWVNSN